MTNRGVNMSGKDHVERLEKIHGKIWGKLTDIDCDLMRVERRIELFTSRGVETVILNQQMDQLIKQREGILVEWERMAKSIEETKEQYGIIDEFKPKKEPITPCMIHSKQKEVEV